MKGINWKDHLVNLLVVIVGITIAFYLESWKEANADKRMETKYLENLYEDLRQDQEYLDTLIRFNEGRQKILETLTNASINRPYNKDSLAFYIHAIQYSPPFTPQNTTYESMKFSGKVELIRDFDFRKRLVELHEQYYRGIQQYDDAVSQHIETFIQPYTIENMVYTGQNSVKSDFLQESRFRNMIFPYRMLVNSRISFYRQVRTEIKKLLKEMESK